MGADEHAIAEELAGVARQLQKESSPTATWQRIVELTVQHMPACESAAISLVFPGGRIDTPAATDEAARAVDRIQYENGQGPCLDAIREHDSFLTADLAEESRWPQFAGPAAKETGIHSMLGFRLFVQEDTLGALNLYSRQVGAFDDSDRTLGGLFAAHAALAMSSAQERHTREGLEVALEGSRIIGLAIGMLMEQRQVDRETAFSILSGASQRANLKLRELAERLVIGHEEQLAAADPGHSPS
jgi:transcriptional regulator with GAF, ATPase, and Fis domain